MQHVALTPGASRELSTTLQLVVSADLLVIAKKTFRNLADVDPAGADLIGIASAASTAWHS